MTVERPSDADPTEIPRHPISVFITYAHEDRAFVLRLAEAIRLRGIDSHGDWVLMPGVEYEEQLAALQLEAEALVFVLSPHSLQSKPCQRELERATVQNQRVLPVLRSDLGPLEETLPPVLQKGHWLYLREDDEFVAGALKLSEAINTDPDLLQEHRWLLQLTDSWRRHDRSAGYLLRKDGLVRAERYLEAASRNPERLPHPTDLQREYVTASRRSQIRGARVALFAMVVAVLVLSVATVVAFLQRNEARRQQDEARLQRGHAEREASIATARMLAARAQELYTRSGSVLPVGLAIAANSVRRSVTAEGDLALRNGLSSLTPLLVSAELPGEVVAATETTSGEWHVITLLPGKTVQSNNDSLGYASMRALDSGAELWRRPHYNLDRIVRISRDGRYVLLRAPDKTQIEVVDAATGRLVWSRRFPGDVWDADVDGVGRRVAVAFHSRPMDKSGFTGPRVAALYHFPDGEELMIRVSADLFHVVFNASGALVIRDGRTAIVQPAEWRFSPTTFAVPGWSTDPSVVNEMVLSNDWLMIPDGRFGNQQLARYHLSTMGYDDRVREPLRITEIQKIGLGSDPNLLATATGTDVRLWDISTSTVYHNLARFPGQPWVMALSRDSNRILVAKKGEVRVWSSRLASEMFRADWNLTGESAFTTNGRIAVLQEFQREVVLDLQDRSKIKIDTSKEFIVNAVAVDEAGNRIAVGGGEHVRVFDRQGGSFKAAHVFKSDEAHAVALSRDGSRLAAIVSALNRKTQPLVEAMTTGKADPKNFEQQMKDLFVSERARLISWDLAAKTGPVEIGTLGDSPGINLVFSPDSTLIAVHSFEDDGVIVFDLKRRQEVARFAAKTSFFRPGLAFSPDGSRLAFTDQTRIHVVSVATWKPALAEIAAEEPGPVAFSPDGRLLATGSSTNEIRLWDAAVGAEAGRQRIAVPATKVQFSPDGQSVYAVSSEGKVHRVPATPSAAIAEACSLLKRDLTSAEWDEFVPGTAYAPVCPVVSTGPTPLVNNPRP